jgi:hypothetical protein
VSDKVVLQWNVFPEEYRATRYFENPYRLQHNMPLRRSYLKQNDVGLKQLNDFFEEVWGK